MMAQFLICLLLFQPLVAPQDFIVVRRVIAPAAGGSTFTLVQEVADQNTLSSTAVVCVSAVCTTTVAATGSGNIGILWAVDNSGSGITLSSVTGGGTWTIPAAAKISNACCGDISGAYTLSTTGGATAIIATFSSSAGVMQVYFVELSVVGGPAAFDTAGTTANTSACTACNGPTISLGGSSDAIVQASIRSAGNHTSADSPYSTNFRNTGTGSGSILSFTSFSYNLNSSSGAAATWNGTSAQTVTAAMAIK